MQKSLQHPGRWLWLLLLIPVALGWMRLKFDVDIFNLLPQDLPAVQGLRMYQEEFADARQLIVTIEAADPEKTETAARAIADHLRSQSNLVAAVTWQPPWLEHPEQTAELLAFMWFNQPPSEFAQLTNRLAPPRLDAILTDARERLTTSMSPEDIALLSYDPYGLTRLPESISSSAPTMGKGDEAFGSADGTFRIMFVKANAELQSYKECETWLNQIKAIAQKALQATAGAETARLGYTGRPAFVSEIAGGMERDMTLSVVGTAVIIAILFWLAHRRLKPMLWLLTLLVLILASTLGLGGLFYGSINVVSMGFAAILLGLAVDYALVHYQEALAEPSLSIPQVRRAIAPSIFWAAVTTISAFLVLNFGGLPGLHQLGSMVAVGVALAATIMIFEYLPPLFPNRRKTGEPQAPSAPEKTAGAWVLPTRTGLVLTGVLLVAVAAILFTGLPRIDGTADPLRPRNSPSYETLARVQSLLTHERQAFWLLVHGRSESDVAETLNEVQPLLGRAQTNGWISDATFAGPLWPNPQNQAQNRLTALHLAAAKDSLTQAALAHGFSERALGLTDRILEWWGRVGASSNTVVWPSNPMSTWVLEKFTARNGTNFIFLGLVNAATNSNGKADLSGLAKLERTLPNDKTVLSGWELLGDTIFSRVKQNLWKVIVPMLVLVLLSLWFAFHRGPEILLSLAVLTLSGLVLLAVMRLCHWSWNLLNLMAIPLVLGTGVDYSIFTQLALRRFGGDAHQAYRAVGRALLLCGATAIAGFGALALSSNAGMASLGQVCTVGIAANMLIAVFLLPTWWTKAAGPATASLALDRTLPPDHNKRLSTPSALYCSQLWGLGMAIVRWTPRPACIALNRLLMKFYWVLCPRRRGVVIRNLAPALNDDHRQATRAAKKLFQNFAVKIVDLFRYEGGLPVEHLLGDHSGWEFFQAAYQKGRGTLLITPHLGNWEFGGPWLHRMGVKLQVITLAEPGSEFTEMRQAARRRWNIETVVIGNDPFAFVDVIRRLEAGAAVALLIDRPAPPTAVEVTLFGKPFHASVAAAELARASGCSILPVYLPLVRGYYAAHILPEIQYDRPALRDRAARIALTQKIVDAFSPVISEHLDQWYNFVPVWPETEK